MEKWTRANYQPNLPLGGDGRKVTACAEHLALARKAGTEGMVLLKNAGKLLPLAKGSRLALFGKGVFDYVKGGGGSGDVTVSHVRNLYDGLTEEAGLAEVYQPLADFYRENVKEQYALPFQYPALLNTHTSHDPLIRRIDHLGNILIRQYIFRNVSTHSCDNRIYLIHNFKNKRTTYPN